MNSNTTKLLLLNPPYINALYSSRKTAAVFMPLGLAYIAAYARQQGQAVEILDANAEDLSETETIAYCVQSDA